MPARSWDGCFIAPSPDHVPPILIHFAERCRSLHEHIFLLTVCTEVIPKVPPDERIDITDLGDGFWRVVLHFGYMERPHVVEVLGSEMAFARLPGDLNEVTYYVGHEALVSSKKSRLNKIAESIFSYLQRNAVDVVSTFCLPARQVIEIGTQVDV